MSGFRIKKTGDWKKARRTHEEAAKETRKRLGVALRRAALLLESEMKKGLQSGAPNGQQFKPLSPFTILQRRNGSSQPLLDTGALLGSINTKVDDDKLEAFVGVHRSTRNSKGDVISIAEIHEFGAEPYAIKVTPALRRFFVALSLASGGAIKPLAKDTTVIHHPGIPARPFIKPAIDLARPKIRKQIMITLERGS